MKLLTTEQRCEVRKIFEKDRVKYLRGLKVYQKVISGKTWGVFGIKVDVKR